MTSSEAPGFYKKKPSERLEYVKDFAKLSSEEASAISDYGALGQETANRMIENVVGTFPLPLGIAANFMVNGKDYMVPMALEEPSVVAAATHMAKGTRETGGITAESDEPVMIGQIQLVNLEDPFAAKKKILSKKDEIVDLANEQAPYRIHKRIIDVLELNLCIIVFHFSDIYFHYTLLPLLPPLGFPPS